MRNSLNNCFIYENRSVDVCSVSEEDYCCQLTKLLRIGQISSIIANKTSNIYQLFRCIFEEFYYYRQFVCDLALEANPCTARCPESLMQWAQVYGVSNCLEENGGTIPLTSELICKLAENRGRFTCDWIKCLAELEGYNVIECGVDCVTCPAMAAPSYGFGRQLTSVDYSCRICEARPQFSESTGFGMFAFTNNRCIEEFNTECERAYAEYPCITCCPSDDLPDTASFEINCEEISRQAGGCSTCQDKSICQAQFPYTGVVTQTQKRPRNHSVLKVMIEGPPPCPAPAGQGYGFGRSFFAGQQNEFSLCLLESQVPLHLCIEYTFSEPAC